jgi:tRNA-Thr(GGU) m(6)t(6)A37 methyltransferase TsaA
LHLAARHTMMLRAIAGNPVGARNHDSDSAACVPRVHTARQKRGRASVFEGEDSMETPNSHGISPIGRVHSSIHQRRDAPRQGWEGAPDARVEIFPEFVPGLEGISAGSEVILLTWLHQSQRDVLKVRPRGDERRTLTGVFSTRSPDRPNPVGLHRVEVLEVEREGWLTVRGLEAIDGTPVIDIKPVLDRSKDS